MTSSVLLGVAGCGGSSTPEPYTDEQGNYRILIVGAAKHSQQKVPTPAGELTMDSMENVDRKGTSRTVIYSDYPQQLVAAASPDAMLDGAVRGMGTPGIWTTESQKPIVIDGHPGREVQFSVTAPGLSEKGTGRARLILVGARLYQTIIIGPASKITAAEIDDFLKSFALLRQVAVVARSTNSIAAGAQTPQVADAKPAGSPALPPSVSPPAAKAATETRPSPPGPSQAARAPMPGGERTVRRGQARAPQIGQERPPDSQPSSPRAERVAQVGDVGPDPSSAARVSIKAKSGVYLSTRPEQSGNERERFRELAPAGGVLVGARVGYIDAFGGSKVGMIQPIFQAGTAYVAGKPHGKEIPPSIRVTARPGYAVGGINTRTGLLLDAFQFVFMKFRDGQLDPADSYASDWLGDPRGGGDGKASGEGKLVVGIHGRSNGREINMLGVIVAE